jgi:hypothetical protein
MCEYVCVWGGGEGEWVCVGGRGRPGFIYLLTISPCWDLFNCNLNMRGKE